MNEEFKSAGIFSRIIAKTIDLIITIVLTQFIPSGGFYIGILYILVSDSLFDQRSIGKKFIGLKVRSRKQNYNLHVRDSIFRNLTIAVAIFCKKLPLFGWIFFLLIIFVELIIMLGNRRHMRIGDELANTEVIESD
ncbi:MAG: RDD family protein [Nitrospirae bacterium]|nr:RDD family protein [Nitrospirota bacterium]